MYKPNSLRQHLAAAIPDLQRDPDRLLVFADEGNVVASTFTIELGSVSGQIHFCMPYSMIEPIRDSLTSSLQGEALEVDKRWIRLMTQQIQIAEVELVASLGTAKVNFDEILNMRVGDIIPLQIPELISATVDGVPVMDCSYGVMNGQYALKVEKLLANTDNLK